MPGMGWGERGVVGWRDASRFRRVRNVVAGVGMLPIMRAAAPPKGSAAPRKMGSFANDGKRTCLITCG